jgi:hypothetical protein
VVAFDGGMFQAKRDTARAPASEDWICLAVAGRNGHTPTVRGTYVPGGDYGALDIVALNGGSFIARRDDPGDCPGAGWQSLTMPGKRGERGLRGERGERGAPGAPGARGEPGEKGETAPLITAWSIDRRSFSAMPTFSDGTIGPPLELRALFEQYQTEAR